MCFEACLTAVSVGVRGCICSHPCLCSLGHYEDGMRSLPAEDSQKLLYFSSLSPRVKGGGVRSPPACCCGTYLHTGQHVTLFIYRVPTNTGLGESLTF